MVAPSMLFPMYTVPLEQALQMSSLEPHEELKSKGKLVEFEAKLGKAAFVSHEWARKDHPDPAFEQFSVFQEAMCRILSDLSHIPLDYLTETVVPGARSLPTKDLRSVPLFIWYDYMSCPQLETDEKDGNQAKAIASIHAYVAACSYFFALCPFTQGHAEDQVLAMTSWRQRGWCRLELTMRELFDGSWILLRGGSQLELIEHTCVFFGSVGEGNFGVADDKTKLGPVLADALKRKMMKALQDKDVVTYRIVRSLQTVYLRGLNVEPTLDLIPGFSPVADASTSIVAEFFHQNGFSSINEVDHAGFRPLHYAALGGNPRLIQALVEHHADLTKTTRKGQPLVGSPPWMSALALCLVCRHNEAAQLLIAAKARVREGGVVPALSAAAYSNNPAGIRLLCESGGDPWEKNLFGFTALANACSVDQWDALQELLRHTGTADLSFLLHAAALSSEGGAQVTERLLANRANIDEQWQFSSSLVRVLFGAQVLQRRLGRVTPATTVAYHVLGATPLMLAVLRANYETAWILITAGARIDLQNARKYSAADLARMKGAPEIIQEVLDGDAVYCRV